MTTYRIKHIAGFEDSGLGNEWATPEEREESRLKFQAYVKELKRTGEYGKPYVTETTLVDNPLYDEPKYLGSSLDGLASFNMVFLDFGSNEDKEVETSSGT